MDRKFLLGFGLSFLLVRVCSASQVILIRHGEAGNNLQKVFNSSLEESVKYPLTARGKVDVFEAAKKLARDHQYENGKIAAVYVSPFLRTVETAKILMETLEVDDKKIIFENEIVEADMGFLDGKPVSPFSYGSSPWDLKRAHEYDGETEADIAERMKHFLQRVRSKGYQKDIVVVTHGAPARQLELLLSSEPPEKIPQYDPAEFRVLKLDAQKEQLTSLAPRVVSKRVLLITAGMPGAGKSRYLREVSKLILNSVYLEQDELAKPFQVAHPEGSDFYRKNVLNQSYQALLKVGSANFQSNKVVLLDGYFGNKLFTPLLTPYLDSSLAQGPKPYILYFVCKDFRKQNDRVTRWGGGPKGIDRKSLEKFATYHAERTQQHEEAFKLFRNRYPRIPILKIETDDDSTQATQKNIRKILDFIES